MLSTHADSSGILSLVFRSLPAPPTTTKKRDADKLERVQKAATTTVSWLEDLKKKKIHEKLRWAGLFPLQKGRLQGVGSGTI